MLGKHAVQHPRLKLAIDEKTKAAQEATRHAEDERIDMERARRKSAATSRGRVLDDRYRTCAFGFVRVG